MDTNLGSPNSFKVNGIPTQLVIKRGPNLAATKDENVLEDWDTLLHSLWLEKIAGNPGFYSDVKGTHKEMSQKCACVLLVFSQKVQGTKKEGFTWIVYLLNRFSRKYLLYIHTYIQCTRVPFVPLGYHFPTNLPTSYKEILS